jgi:hypothetical protein
VSNLLDKIDSALHYNSDGDIDVEALVEVLVEELEHIDKRITTLSRECGIADTGVYPQTTPERCREDNERI